MRNDEKIINALDIGEVLLIWSIELAILHLKLVQKCQIIQAAEELENVCLKIPQGSQILFEIKAYSLICDVRAWVSLAVVIAIFSQTFPIATFINIMSPFLTAIVVVGIFLDIRLTTLKIELILKQMNYSIQVMILRIIHHQIAN